MSHDAKCRCADCRHARFNPGPPTSGRRFTFAGHFLRSDKYSLKKKRERSRVK